jgi:LmbE family N-acetylglucosaminyl deacetylase
VVRSGSGPGPRGADRLTPVAGPGVAAFGASILILCPHPDDEVVACCAAIGRARAQGSKVAVLFLTHGCVDLASMWPWERARYLEVVARRRAESERVADELGLAVAGHAARAARHLWRELADAEHEVRVAIAAFGVDQLWAPAFEGGNPDHDGASAIASRLAAEGLSVLEFAEYNLAGGKTNSHRFPQPNGTETALQLTATEQAAKRRALALYASEARNLGYVGVEHEAFRPLAAYDYAQPPHTGKLWYARFQWVPFPHPRVDFTRPEAVARSISNYLGHKT